MRHDHRLFDQLRDTRFKLDYLDHPLASVMIEMGKTRVICSVSISPGVPKFLKGSNTGWLTAEYSMLPNATHERTPRETSKTQSSGRTLEIQRLIGRSLRNCINLSLLGEHTVTIDCDVIQADGGTRTASINGASVALYLAISKLEQRKKIAPGTFKGLIGAVSCGVVQDHLLLDLNYEEDSHAQSDLNFIIDQAGNFIEIQGSAEERPIAKNQLIELMSLAEAGCKTMLERQKEALSL